MDWRFSYFSWDTLEDIADSGNYFLSRYKTVTALYVRDKHGEYKSFDIAAYLKKIALGEIKSVAVYFGKGKEKRPCRFVCSQVPEDVKNLRLSEYNSKHKGKSKNGTQWKQTEIKKLL